MGCDYRVIDSTTRITKSQAVFEQRHECAVITESHIRVSSKYQVYASVTGSYSWVLQQKGNRHEK